MTSFAAQVVALRPNLMRYARVLRYRDCDAEDLVQDTLLKAISNERHFTPGSNLRSWLFTIMHNENINHLRAARRGRTFVEFNEPAYMATQDMFAETGQMLALTIRDLRAGLAKLPSYHRDTVLLICQDALTYDEAAEHEKVPIGTIRSRMSRARDELRAFFGENRRRGSFQKPGQPKSRHAV
jgi:RNA polymerase sigma-70 factor (ECF subfamily)